MRWPACCTWASAARTLARAATMRASATWMLASAVRANSSSDCSMLEAVKSALLGCLRGYSPLVALEFARKTLPTDMRPSFIDLETHVKGAK